MIARVLIAIPFNILISTEDPFVVYSVENNSGYGINIYPPLRNENLGSPKEPQKLKTDGKNAMLANCIQIDFKKDDFNRKSKSDSDPPIFDPPIELINDILNQFLLRLRYVTRAPQIHPIFLNSVPWDVHYINNDETELEKENGKVKHRGGFHSEFTCIALNQEVWTDIFTMKYDFQSHNWSNLLLDAKDKLPDIGPSLVLAVSALEIFISNILNQFAKKNKISLDLWNPKKYWRQPSTKEQYDNLLKIVTGHSLKEENRLWEAFNNLKTARNNFVHEGIAKTPLKSSKPLNVDETRELIQLANEITLKIREWLPNDLQWKIYSYKSEPVEGQLPVFLMTNSPDDQIRLIFNN